MKSQIISIILLLCGVTYSACTSTPEQSRDETETIDDTYALEDDMLDDPWLKQRIDMPMYLDLEKNPPHGKNTLKKKGKDIKNKFSYDVAKKTSKNSHKSVAKNTSERKINSVKSKQKKKIN